jgi:diguanylate cyclase (GGDEF)-like protein/PAS domain S-box-containing protein
MLLAALALAGIAGLRLYASALTSVRRQREANVALQDSRDQTRSLVDALEEGVVLHHADGRTELLNASARRLAGHDTDVIERLEPGWQSLDVDGRPLAYDDLPVRRALASGEPGNDVVGLKASDGTVRWLSVSARPLFRRGEEKPHAVVATFRDVTEERENELHLTDLAQRDPLTGLWNRRRFEDDLAAQLARCRRYDERAALLVLDLDGFKQLNDTLGHLAGDDVLRALAEALSRRLRASDSAARIGGDEFAVLLPNVDPEAARGLATDVGARLTEFVHEHFGPHVDLSLSVGAAELDGASGGVAEAFAAADQAMYVDKRRSGRPTVVPAPVRADAQAPHLASLRALLTAVQARDSYTATHSRQVVTLARSVARRLGLDDAQTSEIESVALMHDLGKIAVPDSLLHKRGPLTESEWEIMRQHPVVGGQMVASIPELSHLAPAVRAEHERWDGAGYPDGLRGEEIPLSSRIAFVCDAYHAMTSDRPYRAALSAQDAIAEIEREAGRQFCPVAAAALLAVLRAERAVAVATGPLP